MEDCILQQMIANDDWIETIISLQVRGERERSRSSVGSGTEVGAGSGDGESCGVEARVGNAESTVSSAPSGVAMAARTRENTVEDTPVQTLATLI